MSTRRDYKLRMTLLIAALLGAYLAGNHRVPLFDRDEPRYALTSRAMVHGDDWVVPRLMGQVRTAKPPAIYWLQGAAMRLFGEGEFAVRLPGALACAGTLALLAVTLPPLVGRRRATWTCFTLGTSVLVLGVAKVGVIDGVLLLCAAAMQVALLRLVLKRGPESANAALLWGAVGIAGLLKGPVLLGVLVMTLLAWYASRWVLPRGWAGPLPRRPSQTHDSGLLRRLHPLLGAALIALICGPWIVLVSLREPGFISTALSHDVAARSIRGFEGHGQPPGFHLLALLGTWFPWSVLLPATLIAAWRGRTRPVIRFALAAAIGPWLMFEVVVTKLPHYLLVIFPMLALMTADWVARVLRRQHLRSARPWGMSIAAAIYSIVALGFAAAPITMKAQAPAASALAVTWGLVLGVTWVRGHLLAGMLAAGCGMALVVAVAYLTWLGDAPILTASSRTAAALESAGAREAAMVHYREPSLAWYALKRGIHVHEAPGDLLPSDGIFAISTRRAWEQLSPAEQRRWKIVSSIPAKLYNDQFETAEILVVRRSEGSEPPTGTTE